MSFIQQFFTSRDNNANAATFVGQEGRLWWDPITNQIYSSDGNTPGGIPLAGGGGGNGSPGGSNSQVQFNQNGSFGGSVNLTFDSATGALTAVSFVGDGSALTNITGTNVVGEVSYAAVANSVAGANVTGTVANATYADSAGTATTATTATTADSATIATTAASATTAGTVTTAAQPNITSVGTLTSVTATGNLTGGGLYVGGNGVITGNLQVQGNLTYNNITNLTTANLVLGLANTSVGVSANGGGIVIGNTNEASFLYNYGTQQWNSNIGISAAGNVNGSNINTAGVVSATSNVTGGNLNTAGLVSAAGNITGGNVRTAGVVSATGNITGAYFIGNGSQLTGIVSTYGNSNVTSLLAAGVGTNISTTGTVVAGNVYVPTTGNNLSVGHVQLYVANNTMTTDNGSAIQFGVRINTANIFATGLVSGTGNVSGGNLTTPGQVSAVGNITTLGNVSGNFYIGNGSLLTGITGTYGNSNVAAYLPTYTGNLVALTGNVTTTANVAGAYILGNGAALSSITGANVTGTVASATSATSATTAGTVTTAAQPNITSVGTLTSLTVTGNTTSGNLVTQGNVAGPSSYNQPKFIQPNASDPNWAYGIYTDGASAFYMQTQFFGLNQTTRGFRVLEAEGNTVVFSVNGAGLVSAPGNVQGGNLLTSGLISATGNITSAGNIAGTYFIGNGSQLTGIVATSSYGNTNVAAYLASGTNSSNISTTGNVTGAYLFGNGSQLTAGLATYVTANAQANITSVGTLTVANVSGEMQLGNFSGNRFRILQDSGALYIQGGNGIASTGASVIFAPWLNSLANATMVVDIPNRKVAIAKASPSVELDVAGAAAVSGNITGGNLLTGGLISATGNVTGNYILGNGSQLTGIVSSYGNANVAANLAAFGSNPISTTGNVTSGNINTAGLLNLTSGTPFTTVAIGGGNIIMNNGTTDAPGIHFYQGNNNNFGVDVENGTLRFTKNLDETGGTVIGRINADGNIIAVGQLQGATASVSGNITGGNLNAAGLSLSGNVVSAINTTANITTTANISAGNILGTHVGNLTGTTASLSGNVNGGNILTVGLISATGNITGGNILGGANVNATTHTGATVSVTGNINSGNLITAGAVYSNYNTNTANTASFMAQGGNTKGGTGYLDFLVIQNTSGGATNPYKWLRMNSTGGFEIINSAYTTNIFNLGDTGALTIPGPFSIGGKQAVNGPAFSAYANATLQTITSGSQQKVLFQTEEYDTNSNYTNSRFTPTVEGYYQLNAEVRLDGSSGTGEMMIILYKNGAEYKRGTNQSGTQIAASFWAMQVSSVVYANGSTDYFEIYVQQGSGADRTVTAVNNSAITWFNGCMLRGG